MGSIRFPNLGFEITAGNGFTIFGFEIRYYGIILALGLIAGAIFAYREAKRTGQKMDDYIDLTIFLVIGAIIGARLYYVIFEWDYYSQHLKEIIDLRRGGIAIYGAVLGGALTLFIFTRIKKLRFFQMGDTIIPGLLIGQIIGRWGNFFNREAFGGFTDNFFAMQIPLSDVAADCVNESMIVNLYGVDYVQVHPTFLYESALNIIVLVLILIFRDKKKFYGETICRYLVGYGIVRFFVEGLRTDQLQFGNGIAASQLLSLIFVVIGLGVILFMYIRFRGRTFVDPIPVKAGKKGEAVPDNNESEDVVEIEETTETSEDNVEESETDNTEE